MFVFGGVSIGVVIFVEGSRFSMMVNRVMVWCMVVLEGLG